MLFASFVALAITGASVLADTVTTTRNQPAGGDVTILNYALTLEHLENAFYSQGLAKFSDKDFAKAGYPSWVRNRVQTLAADEATHVSFLTGALGASATKPCTYNFATAFASVDAFLATSRVLENVGVSAYLGAAGSIATADYLTAAGAILTVEARHNAVVSEIEGGEGFPAAFDTPLGFSSIYSLAAPFLASCPSSNPALPFTVFPALTIVTPNAKPGMPVQLKFNANGKTDLQLQVLNGLNHYILPLSSSYTAVLPANLSGRAYLLITSGDALTDATTVAGPALLDITPPGVIPSFQKHVRPSPPPPAHKPAHGKKPCPKKKTHHKE